MRKKILTALAFATLAFVGCKKNTPTGPVELSDVQISGVILAHLDYTNDTNASGTYSEGSVADPVSGLRVYTTVNYYYLDETPNGSTNDYKQMVISATTDANGVWTLTVPASSRPYDITIYTDVFYRDVTLADAQGNNVGTELHEFGNMSFDVDDIAAGAGSAIQTETRVASDWGSVNGNSNTNVTGVFKLSGTVFIDHTVNAGDTAVDGSDSTIWEHPAGTVISLYAYYWDDNGQYQEVYLNSTIAADGSYSFNVPTESGPFGGVYGVEISLPDLLLTYTNARDYTPTLVEQQVFSYGTDYLGDYDNGNIVIDQDYYY